MNPPHNQPHSPSLTYFTAYAGLFASLVLAAVCNAFLDIQYGGFGFEVLFWVVVFGLTLRVGWRQRGQLSDGGKQGQKMVLIAGLILSLILFIPVWGFPRAGLAMLAMLQAAQNCVTVTRRQLHFGLLVSAVMVMFAASHYRADWTMLFYLVPYISAVVFTLVAEQINRRAQDLRQQSLGQSVLSGQGVAIAAATSAILLLGALLYTVTPQPTWPYLQWRYGQMTNLGWMGQGEERKIGKQPGGQGGAGQGQGENRQDPGNGGQGQELQPGHGWPSPKEMRQAAGRAGMPEWQKSAINHMADASEWVSMTMKPIMKSLEDLWQSFKDWLDQNRNGLAKSLAILAILALLYALWRLLREVKAGIWLRTRLDYLRFGILGRHGMGVLGARQVYGAMARLFELNDAKRSNLANTREYLTQLRHYGHLYREAAELTRLFEDARYGGTMAEFEQMPRMRELYRRIYQLL